MSKSEDQFGAGATLAEVRAAAEELLLRAAGADVSESDLFPYGVNQIAIHVKAADIEVSLEISGPDHGHEEEEAWAEDGIEDLFDGDENA
jgi:hypothetical protein